MSIVDKINLVTNSRLKTKLLAKFNNESDRDDVLKYLRNWRNFYTFLRVLASILSAGFIPLIYFIWAKRRHQPHSNWVTNLIFTTKDAIDQIEKLPDSQPPIPENQDKSEETEEKREESESELSAESLNVPEDKLRKRFKYDQKTYIGTQFGILYIVFEGKIKKVQLNRNPIINIDIVEISTEQNKMRILLICHENGYMYLYNLDDMTNKKSIPGVGDWFKQDLENNTVSFDEEGNLRVNLNHPEQNKVGKFIIIHKEAIIELMTTPAQSLAELISKERGKLTSAVQSAHSEEESTDTQSDTLSR